MPATSADASARRIDPAARMPVPRAALLEQRARAIVEHALDNCRRRRVPSTASAAEVPGSSARPGSRPVDPSRGTLAAAAFALRVLSVFSALAVPVAAVRIAVSVPVADGLSAAQARDRRSRASAPAHESSSRRSSPSIGRRTTFRRVTTRIPSACADSAIVSPTRNAGGVSTITRSYIRAQAGEDLGDASGTHELARVGRQRPRREHVERATLGVPVRTGIHRLRARCGLPDGEIDAVQSLVELEVSQRDVADALRMEQPEEAVDIRSTKVEVDEARPCALPEPRPAPGSRRSSTCPLARPHS